MAVVPCASTSVVERSMEGRLVDEAPTVPDKRQGAGGCTVVPSGFACPGLRTLYDIAPGRRFEMGSLITLALVVVVFTTR